MKQIKNKFYKEYKLKKELPELPIGTILKWDLWTERYSEVGQIFGISEVEPKVSYTKDFINSRKDWFEPIGEPIEFYPKFPDRKDFFHRENGHAYIGEFRHNSICRVCQLIEKLDIDKKLEDAMYNVVKEEYKKRFLKENNK